MGRRTATAAALLAAVALALGVGPGGRDGGPAPPVPGPATEAQAPRARSAPSAPPSCRCPERTLDEYYGEAAEVVLARLTGSDEASDFDRRLHMEVVATAWKTAGPDTEGPLLPGDRVAYLTARSNATCGIQPVPDAVYLVFGHRDPDGGLRVESCSGTRVYRGGDAGAEPAGFSDVPGRFVISRLEALSGLEVLRAVAAAAPDPADPENTALVGLLDLAPLAHGGMVPVRAAPRGDAPVVATVERYEQVASREVGYEVGAAVVVARLGGWSRIPLSGGGHGWVAPEEGGTWFPYVDLPVRRLAYLTGSWSGHLWPGAGAGNPTRSRDGGDRGEEVPVTVHEGVLVGGLPWFRVDVLASSPCEGTGTPVRARSGWVPGYGPDGSPTVWYWSRGC